MTNNSESKHIILTPSWKHFFWGYLLSVLTIPIFGLGLIGLYFVRKKHTNIVYRISDTQISSVDSRYQRNIDLVNIEEVNVRQNGLQKTLGIGTLVLYTSAAEMEIVGMQHPVDLKGTIEKAVAYHKEQAKKKNFRQRPDPKYKPGAMEKMDYLTGLWQQGLLSNEDYENEKKNFE